MGKKYIQFYAQKFVYRNLWEIVPPIVPPRGVLSFFSLYIGLGPATTVHPQKYKEFQAHQKIFEILATQKIIPHSAPWPQEKTLKCIEMTPKYSSILWCPPPPQKKKKKKYPQYLLTPKNIYFSKTPQKYWNSKFWTQINGWSLRMYENIRVPAPPWNSICHHGMHIYNLQAVFLES